MIKKNQRVLSIGTIELWLINDNHPGAVIALSACAGRNDIPFEWIEKKLDDRRRDVRAAALKLCRGRRDVSLEWIKKALHNYDGNVRASALNLCRGRSDVPLEWIEKALQDDDWSVRSAAMNACVDRDDIPLEWIENKLDDYYDSGSRTEAIKTCANRDNVPLEWIKKILKDDYWYVRLAAINACINRHDVPLEWIAERLNDEEYTVRVEAIKTCAGRDDIPLEWIEKRFNDSSWSVRVAAMHYLKIKNLPIPFKRTFEPSAVVYKKCLNGVIVCAEIPADAQVRGAEGHKCRADKAKIIDIIGDFYGEQVGVSTFDNSTLYFVGDEIEIEDFDCGDAECSTGFHFFCTKEEAKKY